MRSLRRFLFNWQNLLALAVVGFYFFIAAAAPLLAPPENPEDPSPFKIVGRISDHIPQPPREGVPLGTLPGQIDVYYTLIWGTRQALRFGLVVSLVTGCLGVLIGATSGYVGGVFNGLTLRIADAFLTFPVIGGVYLIRQMAVSEYLSSDLSVMQRLLDALNMDPVMLTLIFFSWMPYARIINASVTRLKKVEYVTAAISLGARGSRIIFRHLLPNVISPAIVLVARDIGAMVLLEAAFTFIGVGGNSPWGTLAVVGRNFVVGPYGNPLSSWWVYLPVTIMLILFGAGWNLLGDGLNNLLNPRSAR